MLNRDAMKQELLTLIQRMNIPSRRKTVEQTEDLRWLKRSLARDNAEHTNFKRAMEILKEIV